MGERGRPVGSASPPTRLTAPSDEDRDPALGEKVSRCAVCGIPAKDYIVGEWTGDGLTYQVRLCAHCVKGRQPNGDPLTVAA